LNNPKKQERPAIKSSFSTTKKGKKEKPKLKFSTVVKERSSSEFNG